MADLVSITDENFVDEVEKSGRTVLIDCWAETCASCKALKPRLEQIAEEQDTVKIVALNVMQSPRLANKFKVMSLPTMLVVKGGAVVDRMEGAFSIAFIKQKLAMI